MITSDHCSASVFVNSWFFLITLITTGKNECCFFFSFFEYLISPWSSLGFWQLLCFMMRLQIQRWLMAFHIGKTFFAWEQVNMTMRILRENSVFSRGEGCLSRAYQKRELVLKSDFSQPCGLQFDLKTPRGGAGVCWEVFHEIKGNS